MSIETVARITTVEGNTYELPSADAPQLWGVTLSIAGVKVPSGNLGAQVQSTIVHVERQTLVNAGLLPQVPRDAPKPEAPETVENLILRLLGCVGVFPE